MSEASATKSRVPYALLIGLVGVVAAVVITLNYSTWFAPSTPARPQLRYQARKGGDPSGFSVVLPNVKSWKPDASLEEVSNAWKGIGFRIADKIDQRAAQSNLDDDAKIPFHLDKATLFNYEGDPKTTYKMLEHLRSRVESKDRLAEDWLFTIIYAQGVTALRRGEDDNCIMCRGESSCIIPINQAAIHINPLGSQLAIKHFSEYLKEFPDDLEVAWLLNLAHMTLGEHPHKVDPAFLVTLDRFDQFEFNIGVFRDIGHLAGVNRLNQSGGAIMEDFHGKGLLDIVVTSFDPTEPMALYRNKGDGTFEDRTKEAGLLGQVGGGLYCVQTDYNNDGHMDIFIPRGAWLTHAVRPSLLKNNGNGTFADITKEAGLDHAMNSGSAAWADFDNDSFLDLFICGEKQPSRLYRNKGDGSFEDITEKSGLPTDIRFCKGTAWIDFDNDGYPDLFLNNFIGTAQLYRNNGNGTFTDVTKKLGIDGPQVGFSCWAFDFDNDGYLDIFATSYDRSLNDVILGLQGKPHTRHSNKLYRNLQGKGFQDVTKEAGLDMVFATMGSNFGDFDNDGYLDIYLGTGDPNLATLVPNRMFKNVAGKRFAEITTSSRTGQLQKGHAVACGDWRRTGNLDIFIEMGGAINGDKYHNVLFLNPGQGNNWLNVKLIGKKTNRAAIGARIKVVSTPPSPPGRGAGGEGAPLTVHRHVTSGSSFGANPLEQTIGLGKADKVATLEITWPTTGTTQVFRDVDVNQAIEITEFATDYRKLNWKALPTPK
ncbi:MAG: CRTAC1 family protein [Gemmataceae bacterium]|nr:CRTAC1 family protein [Gemmataceae bacterium]